MNTRPLLLVEDNPDEEELTLRALRRGNIGGEIAVVRDGAEAIEFLFGTGRHSGRDVLDLPGLVLMDLKLPKTDGSDVLRRLRADWRTRSVPVVIFTSSREERDVMKSYALGVNSYVCKPVNSEQFANTVQQIGMYWLFLNEPLPR